MTSDLMELILSCLPFRLICHQWQAIGTDSTFTACTATVRRRRPLFVLPEQHRLLQEANLQLWSEGRKMGRATPIPYPRTASHFDCFSGTSLYNSPNRSPFFALWTVDPWTMGLILLLICRCWHAARMVQPAYGCFQLVPSCLISNIQNLGCKEQAQFTLQTNQKPWKKKKNCHFSLLNITRPIWFFYAS